MQIKSALTSIESMLSDKRKALIMFILFACLFYLDKIFLGPYSYVMVSDSLYPDFQRFKITGELLFKYGIFKWYPHLFGGLPAFAYHYPPYFPWTFAAVLLPHWLFYSIMVILFMIIAGFGMYWFLKDFLNIETKLAFAGGVFFSLYSQVQTSATLSVVFNYVFPLFFMIFLTANSKNADFKTRAACFMSIILIMFFSYPVLTLPLFLSLQLLVVVFLNPGEKYPTKKIFFRTILMWAGYLLLFLPIIYALYKSVPLIQRKYFEPFSGTFLHYLFVLKNSSVEHLVVAMTTSGIFLLLVWFLPLLFYSNKLRRTFALFCTLLFFAAFFTHPLLAFVSGTIFGKMDLDHFIFLLPFASTIFIITGFSELFTKKLPRFLHLVCFSSAFLFYFWLRFHRGFRIEGVNFTLPLLISIFYAVRKWPFLARLKPLLFICGILLLVTVIFQFRMLRFNAVYENVPYRRYLDNHPVFGALKSLEGNRPFRVGTLQSASNLNMIAQSYSMETVGGRTATQPKYYKEFFKEIARPQLEAENKTHDFDSDWYNLDLTSRFNLPLLLLLNTKYLLADKLDAYLEAISEEVIQSGNPSLYIYKLKNAFERGYLVKDAVVLPSDNDVLNTLARQPIEKLRENAYFCAKDSFDPDTYFKKEANQSRKGLDRVNLTYYSPDKIVFDGIASSPCALVVSNSYHPNWKAALNGKETKVYRANHAFQAILIEGKGAFRAVFEYKDPSIWKAHIALPFGIVLIGLSVL